MSISTRLLRLIKELWRINPWLTGLAGLYLLYKVCSFVASIWKVRADAERGGTQLKSMDVPQASESDALTEEEPEENDRSNTDETIDWVLTALYFLGDLDDGDDE